MFANGTGRLAAHLTLAIVLGTSALYGCKKDPPAPAPEPSASAAAVASASAAPPPAVVVPDENLQFFKALPGSFESPPENPSTPEKVQLGRMLFFENRLSKNQDISCNSCHDLAKFGVDGLRFSIGHKGQKGDRSAPTVFNTGGHVAQFWDGRAKNLEAQAKGPILNPVEMAMLGERQVVSLMKSIPGYVDAFKKAFGADKDPVTFDNLAKAIAAFERNLVTPSRFDKFMGGDLTALTNKEKEGLNTFVGLGCGTCHNGPAVGGNSFQKLGVVKPFQTKDLGRFNVTKAEVDKGVFRVPSLRNIEMTAPYMHDGETGTLEEMVKLMANHQLGKTLTDAQVDLVVSFLKSLTGTPPADLIAKPDLPPSTAQTPKPDPK
jgi:cytochrome c peroxidase